MKTIPNKYTWKVTVLTAMLFAVYISSAIAQRQTVRVGSEAAVGGLTIAEQAARSFRLNEELKTIIPPGLSNAQLRIDITQMDRDELSVSPVSGKEPLRIGIVKPIPIFVGKAVGQNFTGGAIEQGTEGSFVWAVELTSPGAQAIRVHLTNFSLPQNTEMYLLGQNGQAYGPYVENGRNKDGDFWTRSIASDICTVVLEYTGNSPDIDRPKMSFTISDIGHIRGRPSRPHEKNGDTWPCSDNAPCLVDVNCADTEPARLAENAIAKMEWIKYPYIYTCTGGLLADTESGTQIPYFLTANHCLSSSNSDLETFFSYRTDSCNGFCPDSAVSGNPPPPASTIGATVMATGKSGDFTLLKLDQTPPNDVTFLGWNNAPVAYSNGTDLYRISNPDFGPQVYSEHLVDANSPECNGWPRGERIYSEDRIGATMGGSSGSPVVNKVGEVVGQLSGCCGYNCADECDSDNNWTVDGALAFYWDEVSDFLNPPVDCTSDGECDDNLFCTGKETCVDGSCQSGDNPCAEASFICNESNDTCDLVACDNDTVCESGEDCSNCPYDCRQKTVGKPGGRFCCDGDLSDCGDAKCSEDGWICAGGNLSGCSSNSDCDDGLWCNGAEICSNDSCQKGSDPCTGQGCDEGNHQCITCGGNKDTCNDNSDCCSGVCKNGTCRGN